MNSPGFNDEDIRRQIASIASSFKSFQCQDCALAIIEFLVVRDISGKHVKLYTGRSKGKYGNIYHDRLGRNISTNGRHEGKKSFLIISIARELLDKNGWIVFIASLWT